MISMTGCELSYDGGYSEFPASYGGGGYPGYIGGGPYPYGGGGYRGYPDSSQRYHDQQRYQQQHQRYQQQRYNQATQQQRYQSQPPPQQRASAIASDRSQFRRGRGTSQAQNAGYPATTLSVLKNGKL